MILVCGLAPPHPTPRGLSGVLVKVFPSIETTCHANSPPPSHDNRDLSRLGTLYMHLTKSDDANAAAARGRFSEAAMEQLEVMVGARFTADVTQTTGSRKIDFLAWDRYSQLILVHIRAI